MKIINARTNHLVNLVGYQMERPVFSYQVVEAEGKKQVSGRIRVSLSEDMSETVYDSGAVADMDSIAFPVDLPLKPRTRYYWNVEVKSDAGETAVSETQFFETGKRKEAWQGKWIFSQLNQGIQPVFFKDFEAGRDIKSARLYISGLGLYEAYLNGRKAGEEFLTPYCNDYTQWIQYQTNDVTELLKKEYAEEVDAAIDMGEGRHAEGMKSENESGAEKKAGQEHQAVCESDKQFVRLEVLLGNGWYKGRFGLDDDGRTRELYGNVFALIAELHVQYEDGREEVFATDESWKARKSHIIESSFYDGEEVDMTMDTAEVFPVSLWKKEETKLKDATLEERLSVPVRKQETIEDIKVIHTPKDELVLDLGQNHSGWFSLKIREKKGQRIHLLFGEELQDGCFFNGNLRTGKSEYFYTADGKERTIRPHFTTFGYRYVKLEGVTRFEEGDYEGWVLYSDLTETVKLSSGNPLIDKLVKNAVWGQKSNFVDIPMDCPQRDERMGWTGDAQVFSPTACVNMDSYAFYRKFLYDMKREQSHREGAVPFTVPACGQESSCGIWGDAVTIIPMTVYENYGDKEILERQYESMCDWISYIRKANGENWGWRKGFSFGDWLALDSRDSSMPTGGTDTGYLVTLYYYQSVKNVIKAAEVLGKTEDVKKYQVLADEILEEIQDEYFSKHGRLCSDTQTGYLTALRFQVAPDEKRMRGGLRQAFKRNGDKLETGFVGTGMLCEVLSENGMDDLAYSLILNEGYPGWLYSVKKGATTIWERWDSLDEEGHFSKSGLNSLNHYSYGTVVVWLYRYAAGIRPQMETPGYRKVLIDPRVDHRLGKLDVSIDSPVGTYRSAWEILSKKEIRLTVDVPFGGEAVLVLPYADASVLGEKAVSDILKSAEEVDGKVQCTLPAGHYEVAYQTNRSLLPGLSVESSLTEIMGNERAKEVMMKIMPQITMLPESLYDRSLIEVMQMGGSEISGEQIAGINSALEG